MPINFSADDFIKNGKLGGKIHEGDHFFQQNRVDLTEIRRAEQFPESSVTHLREKRSKIGNINPLFGKSLDRAV